MNHKINLEGFENQNIEVKTSFWAGPKLLVSGEPAQKGTKRGEMIIQRDDGQQVIATWKPQFLGLDLPQLVVDGKVEKLVEPLKWYQWVWGGWPIFLLFLGGALGAIAGMISVAINAKIFRTELSEALKYLVSGVIAVLAVAAYFVAATILTFLING
ncbi:MAG: hypothetical protein ABFS17_07635 [Chloroflexota bacterium]